MGCIDSWELSWGDLGGCWGVLERSWKVFFRRLLVGGLQFFSWAVMAGLRALLVVYCLSLHVLCHPLRLIAGLRAQVFML